MEQFEKLMAPVLCGNLLLSVALVAFLPAVSEEMLFRGIMLSGFSRRSKTLGVVLTALLFSMVHFYPRALPIFPLGLVLGYVVIRTGSIFAGMLVHFANNAATLVVARLGNAGTLSEADISPGAAIAIFAVAAVIFAASICLLPSERGGRTAPQ